ncbi:hypothetical protein P154DRAFT_617075 [Amniculicola lignicola CBS 123094]|uniref:Uncharacterized protein n=1 Tax=Amniculicola lignicola CBS 123094 TaxID=1392246 RepID=A0A6A5WS74_9PLEO|nr:hypothetical protein P154DRAFT_617075 [Amniculicola lignicola CBS 123094]
MALNYAPAQARHPHEHSSPASYASHCSLRGTSERHIVQHPLKQNPPSIIEEIGASRFDDIDITDSIVRPPPSALTAAATAYDPHNDLSSPLDPYSPPSRSGHQRSLTDTFFTNCQPLINRATNTLQQHTSRASFHSPTKSLAAFIPTRSHESSASQPSLKAGAKVLSNWFNGTSAPVNLGLPASPSKERTEPQYDSDSDSEHDDEEDGTMMANIFNRSTTLTRSSTSPDTTPTKAPATTTAASKFSWLLNTQKSASVAPPPPSPKYHNPSDELLNMNISQSLFPHGPVDPLDPSSFHDLVSNAESLLSRYQLSYRTLSSALSDSRAEQSAIDDELDESETRVRHLKMQLETMAARAADQDTQMRQLMEDLAFERRARQEEDAARKRSLAMIRGPGCQSPALDHTPRRRMNRVSNSDVSVDSGFESDAESEAPSVFSRGNGAMSPTGTAESDASSISLASPISETTPTNKSVRPQLVGRRSTYDKVLHQSIELEKSGWGCANCEGGAQSSVWGRLAKEREENGMLKRRVEGLEEAVEGALKVVDGVWGM